MVSRDLRRADRDRRRAVSIMVVAGVVGLVLVLTVVAVAFGGPSAEHAAARVVGVAPTASEALAVGAGPSVAVTAPAATAAAAPSSAPVAEPKPVAAPAQRFTIRIGTAGYEPSVVSASSGRPITLVVGKGEGCAAGFLMESLGIDKDNSSGPVTIKLGVLKPGTYRFTCGMGMVEGRLVVP